MLQALRTRDVYLVAGCAGAGAVFLAVRHAGLRHRARRCVDPRAQRDARGARMTRRSASRSSPIALLAAVAAPLLAPHATDAQFAGLLNAPPTRGPHSSARTARWHAPFIYRWQLVNQLEQRYEEDRSAPRAAARGSPAAASCNRRTRPRRRCCCSAPTASAATCSRGCCSARACRSASRSPRRSARWCSARRSAASPATPAARSTKC